MITRNLRVCYDIIPSESISSQAVSFNVTTWTLIPYLPGRTGFTANEMVFRPASNQLKIDFAIVRCVFQANQSITPVIQIAGFYYDSHNTPIWDYSLGEFTKRPQFNPDNQGIDITAKLTALLALANISNPQVTVRVNGNGILQEARIEVDYSVPDFSDDIAALSARIDALGG